MERIDFFHLADYIDSHFPSVEAIETAMVSATVLKVARTQELPQDLVDYHRQVLDEMGLNPIDVVDIPREVWLQAIDEKEFRKMF